MTSDQLSAVLARRVMEWRVGPDRFLMGNRRWLPRWRFRPSENLKDAHRLLEQLAPREYRIDRAQDGQFLVRIHLAGACGEARDSSQARALTFAIARAIGIEVEGVEVDV